MFVTRVADIRSDGSERKSTQDEGVSVSGIQRAGK